jgi:hypothetical protein
LCSLISCYMRIHNQKSISLVTALVCGCMLLSCRHIGQSQDRQIQLMPGGDLGTTIGSLVEIAEPEPIPVEGYGLVGGLSGTGSAECPPQVREYLKRYVLAQLPRKRINVDRFIDSPETAVVWIEGTLPAAAPKGQRFDLRISALPGTQTISLEDGWLYRAELKPRGTFGIATRVIAAAEGPVFMDKINNRTASMRIAYVLYGGKVLEEYLISMILREPDYRTANLIRNLINERFASGTARAISSDQVELRIPAKYKTRVQRFISIVQAMYISRTPELDEERAKTFAAKLAVGQDKYASEITLEAIGSTSLDKLKVLLNSSDEHVRLLAGRCMINIGSEQGVQPLREIAMNGPSAYQLEALEALTAAAKPEDAASVARRLLQDPDFDIMLAAYSQLRKLDDIAITKKLIGRSFFLEQVAQTKQKAIYVSRRGQPRIVLFGAPLHCRDNVFIQSVNGDIVIDSRAGQQYVSIMRKHPTRPTVIGPLKCSFKLSDIIQILCEEPVKEDGQQGGLGVSYAEIIALLKQICDKDAVQAEFWAGPLPDIH